MNSDRIVRREKRRRGAGTREVDLDDIKIGPLPELQPRIEEAQQRVIEQHKKIVQARIKIYQNENKKESVNLYESNTDNRDSSVKYENRRKTKRKSKSIKIKYRRVPSNKVKLIYIDVIKMMIQEYLKDKRINEYLVKKFDERGKEMMREYIERIDDYFSTLIDLRLSNSLIKTDLDKIAAEKNKLRANIYDVRKERSDVGLELKSVRTEFKEVKDKLNSEEKLYKQLLSLKNGDEKVDEGNIVEELSHNIDCSYNKNKTLKLLQQINEILKATSGM